jgi:hypothetical protein
MRIRCERRGQLEIGILEQDGRVYAAFGAGVHTHNITAFTTAHEGRIVLTTWCGKVMLACRSEVVRTFWDGSLALMFRLTHDRYIVGYALGDNGMLFRGELLTDCDDERARWEAMALVEYWAAIDAEDEADTWHGEPTEPEGGIFS